jgi:hypothetical protein
MPDYPPRIIACVGAVVLHGQYRLIPPELASPYQPHLAFL